PPWNRVGAEHGKEMIVDHLVNRFLSLRPRQHVPVDPLLRDNRRVQTSDRQEAGQEASRTAPSTSTLCSSHRVVPCVGEGNPKYRDGLNQRLTLEPERTRSESGESPSASNCWASLSEAVVAMKGSLLMFCHRMFPRGSTRKLPWSG